MNQELKGETTGWGEKGVVQKQGELSYTKKGKNVTKKSFAELKTLS